MFQAYNSSHDLGIGKAYGPRSTESFQCLIYKQKVSYTLPKLASKIKMQHGPMPG